MTSGCIVAKLTAYAGGPFTLLVNDEKVEERLSNPNNLMNKLREISHDKKNSPMSLFGIGVRSITKPTLVQKEVSEIKEPEKPQEVTISFNPFAHKEAAAVVPSKPNTVLPKDNPSINPTTEQLMPESDAQIKLGIAHDQALSLLTDSVAELKLRLAEVKADKLPAVISSASKVVESIRRERIELNKKNNGNEVHFHFYTPEQKKLEEYETIDV